MYHKSYPVHLRLWFNSDCVTLGLNNLHGSTLWLTLQHSKMLGLHAQQYHTLHGARQPPLSLLQPTAHYTNQFQRGRLQLYAGMDNTAAARVPIPRRVCTALVTKMPTPQHSVATLPTHKLALGACTSDKQDQAGKTYRPEPPKRCANKRTRGREHT